MKPIDETLRRANTITFDCYGTLIDWRTGLRRSLCEVFARTAGELTDDLFDAYVEIEAEVEAQGYRPYREILSTTVERLAVRFNVDLPTGRTGLLTGMLPQWLPFADTNEALGRLKQRYRLGVLSNIDRDLFAATARHFDVTFDFVVTAEDVRAYKPSRAHFERLLAAHSPLEKVVHAAQSLFHDGAPSDALGIAYVWINRYNNSNATAIRPLAVYPDLSSLADAACGR